MREGGALRSRHKMFHILVGIRAAGLCEHRTFASRSPLAMLQGIFSKAHVLGKYEDLIVKMFCILVVFCERSYLYLDFYAN